MVMTVSQGIPLVDGHAEGLLLKLRAPICFWGGLDAATGLVSDPKHADHGADVSGKILAVPNIVGSSSSSQILLELLYKGKAPAAIILGEADAIIAMAVLVGREMGFGAIPILQGRLDALMAGARLEIMRGGCIRVA
jgi:predicted aconitase with swiveling domain